ncbi:hypothetical protein KAI87_13825, partial [Myxococcota bacterium]|nr:hypothetical protein [Myxococcota bacterium]
MTNMNFPEDSPLALIKTHLNQKDTGEVVSFDGNSEIHVYLQNGFIAWATHSKAKFSFTRHLLEDVGLDKDSLKEVIKECRRTGKKIGEALIEWKLATPEQVTQALRVQVRDAVGALQTQSDPRSLFLPRSGSFADYDETITFSLEEILEPPKVAQVSETPEYIPEDQAEDQA